MDKVILWWLTFFDQTGKDFGRDGKEEYAA